MVEVLSFLVLLIATAIVFSPLWQMRLLAHERRFHTASHRDHLTKLYGRGPLVCGFSKTEEGYSYTFSQDMIHRALTNAGYIKASGDYWKEVNNPYAIPETDVVIFTRLLRSKNLL